MGTLSEKPVNSQAGTGRPPSSTAKRIARVLAIAAIALAGASLFAVRVNPARMDYIEYWTSGHLLVHLANPYSPIGILKLEKAHGFLPSSPLIMLNPPWALFLVAPLGFTGFRDGLVLWILILAACIIFSTQLLNPRSNDNALVLLFAPAIACIGSGQSSPFLLLGFALFLHFHQRRPIIAGASLLLMAIKPHLFLVFWVVLLIDCIRQRKFLIFAGGVIALTAATAVPLLLDQGIWQGYFAAFRATPLKHQFFPTISALFRLVVDSKANWLLLVPSTVATFWGLWYYTRNRKTWDWTKHGMLLMLVTVLASPYGWFTDEIVLLPSIIFALNLPQKRKYSGWILLAINAAAAIIYTAFGASLQSPVLVWTPIAWLAWFLYATYWPRHRYLANVQVAA